MTEVCHSDNGVWSGSFVPSILALPTGVVKGPDQSFLSQLFGS